MNTVVCFFYLTDGTFLYTNPIFSCSRAAPFFPTLFTDSKNTRQTRQPRAASREQQAATVPRLRQDTPWHVRDNPRRKATPSPETFRVVHIHTASANHEHVHDRTHHFFVRLAGLAGEWSQKHPAVKTTGRLLDTSRSERRKPTLSTRLLCIAGTLSYSNTAPMQTTPADKPP